MNTKTYLSLSSLLALAFIGCGDAGDEWTKNQPATSEASGIITLDGKPIEGASIVAAPDGGQHAANSISAADGSFSLRAFRSKEGAVPGKYLVAASKTTENDAALPDFDPGEDAEHANAPVEGPAAGWKNLLPKKYASPSTSGIVIEVPADGVSDLKIELTSS